MVVKHNRSLLLIIFATFYGICQADQYSLYRGYITLGEYRKMTKAEQSIYLIGQLDGILTSPLLNGIRKESTQDANACVMSYSKEQYVEKMQNVITTSGFPDSESMQRFGLYLKSLCSKEHR